ncbi:phosphonate ABC transporter substrate-binding protein [Cardiobacteriaceae bacterium TAE3-ERU3]|nr:phosphonate ABC transporter substrate-binding protein [Cardiobacteriaceae bacterium TAE3-ERU3]
MKSMVKKLAVVVASALTFSSVVSAEELNFGIISTESSSNLKTVWTPFLEDMSEQLGMEVKPFFATDYAGIIEGMRFGKVDIAWYGNKSAMEAVDRANGEIFAQTVAADGSPGYWSLIVAHKDSPLNSLEDMIEHRAELTFGNGDPNSTSGYLVPAYYVFALNNIDPSDFKRSMNANHEANLLSVANKQVDVATNNTESLARLKATAPEKAELIKVLWKSPLIPGDPIVWNKDLDDETKEKVRNFFLNYGTQDEQEKEVLLGLEWAPFQTSDNDQLIPIRQLAVFKDMSNLKNDDTVSAEEKAKKMAEYEATLKELDAKLANKEKQSS